jgi:hypothetical protein|tara:strand:+ start:345 stop:557 length:213 start_codon:yes stop_codon:yes gene_type:complete
MIEINKPYCNEESYKLAGINAFGSIDSVESDGWMYICSVLLAKNGHKKLIEDTFKNKNTKKSKTVLRIII